MLRTTFAEGLLFYTAIWLAVIVFLWLRELRRARRAEWELTKGKLFNCNYCHHTFIVKEMKNVARCPRCNAMCILRKRRP